MTVGMNLCNNLVFLTKNASSRQICLIGVFLQQIAYTSGGVWINFLAYLLLEKMGWRMFLLVSSLPVFIPPVVILQFFIRETHKTGTQILCKDESSSVDASSTVEKEQQPVTILQNDYCKIGLLSCIGFITLYQGNGSILLAPSIIRTFNSKANGLNNDLVNGMIGQENDPCKYIVKGVDFLILTAVNGATNLLGRIIGFAIHGRCSYRIIQTIFSLGLVACYGSLLGLQNSLAVASVLMGIIKLIYSIQLSEISFVTTNPSNFGRVLYSTGCAFAWGSTHLGGTLGTAFSAFLDPWTAVTIALTLSCVKVVCTALLDI